MCKGHRTGAQGSNTRVVMVLLDPWLLRSLRFSHSVEISSPPARRYGAGDVVQQAVGTRNSSDLGRDRCRLGLNDVR